MGKRPKGYWVAMAYLIATVATNGVAYFPLLIALGQSPSVPNSFGWFLVANLGIKVAAIILLFGRRAEGIYPLAAAFVIGLAYTIWQSLHFHSWEWLRPMEKVGRASGFLISLAVIGYMILLARRGILNGKLLGITGMPTDGKLTLSEFD